MIDQQQDHVAGGGLHPDAVRVERCHRASELARHGVRGTEDTGPDDGLDPPEG